MKKLFIPFAFLLAICIIACNDSGDNHAGHGNNTIPKTQADSLMKDVMEGHNTGMAKMGKLTRAEQTARRLLDSIAKLPAKARKAAEPLKAKLDSLQKELSYAEIAMVKWMTELKEDSAINNMEMEERIKYLSSEKLKVSKVKENILNGLQHADSILKGKF